LQWAFDKFNIPVNMHQEDQEVLDMLQASGIRFGMQIDPVKVDVEYIKEGDELELDGEKFKIYHVPGHSPGSVVYHNENQKFMISGDVLFEGSIGRTDLYKGNYDQLIDGIKTKLFILDNDTQVFSGHGNPTSIGFEKQYNPFLK
ncbi:MBL fold metallo-hydrolase, partial [Streptomyces doebereineriae]